ncbi:MAG: hypothetical protein ACYCYF_03180 [Anaerolineae bacterium]
MIVILDFDGTLTAEEAQAPSLARRSLKTLASEVLQVPIGELLDVYRRTRTAVLAAPWDYGWWVNGLLAGYPDEGAFQCNTVTLQTMLSREPRYVERIAALYPAAEYDPVVDCTNWLFHRHTAELGTAFRSAALPVLQELIDRPDVTPLVLTNSLGDKVARQLATLPLTVQPEILGDTRQYEMAPDWPQRFDHPNLGAIQTWPVSARRSIDLRRPAYYAALRKVQERDPQVAVVADSLSLPGALPLMMGIPFYLLRTPYTPRWCMDVVSEHLLGTVLERLQDLPGALRVLKV